MLYRYFDSWVVVQDVLLLSILFSPWFMHTHLFFGIRLIGLALLAIGIVLLLISFFNLGSNFTTSLQPREDGLLVDSGLYTKVRHPMYFALVLMTLGWSIYWASLLGLVLSIVLWLVLYGRARNEEKLLLDKFPHYAEYRNRVPYIIIPYLF
jgi:protein-S-isoprenylcysteine O-methyltransferase Ste14